MKLLEQAELYCKTVLGRSLTQKEKTNAVLFEADAGNYVPVVFSHETEGLYVSFMPAYCKAGPCLK